MIMLDKQTEHQIKIKFLVIMNKLATKTLLHRTDGEASLRAGVLNGMRSF
jgi:hypothetical protein